MLGSGADAIPTRLALAVALEPFLQALAHAARMLAEGWGVAAGPGSLMAGAIGHAVAFPTWRSLRHQTGLTDRQAVELMVGMVDGAREASAAVANVRETPRTPNIDEAERRE